jgi:hypothetical protein
MLAPSPPHQKNLLVRNLKDLLPVRRELEMRARLEAERQATIWAAKAQ